jgi:hypothetical protein
LYGALHSPAQACFFSSLVSTFSFISLPFDVEVFQCSSFLFSCSLVIGFDDVQFSKFYTPSLTTIAQDRQTLGEMAAKHLIEMIEGSKVSLEKITRIPVKLVIRESTQ